MKPVEPTAVPVIEAGAIWKKAKDCANDNFKRGKELREVLIYYKAAVKELQDRYGVGVKQKAWARSSGRRSLDTPFSD